MAREFYVLVIAVLAGLGLIAGRPQPTNSPIASINAKAAASEDFAAHVEQLKKKLPTADFSIVIQPPFVVVGDEPADAVK